MKIEFKENPRFVNEILKTRFGDKAYLSLVELRHPFSAHFRRGLFSPTFRPSAYPCAIFAPGDIAGQSDRLDF